MSTDLLPQKGSFDLIEKGPQAEPLELLLYWRTVYKRKWWILGIAAVAAALAAFAISIVTPIYRATVTLLIEQSKAKLVSIDEVYSGVSANREHYQTQAEMLKSPTLAATVIGNLGLATHPEFDPRQQKRSAWTKLLPAGAAKPKTDWRDDEVQAAVLADFLRRITIEPIRQSQLVKLSFDSADPKLAAQIANAIADAYLETDIDIRAKITQRAGDWLAERLSGLKRNLEESERALQDFREREGMLDIQGLAQGGASRQVEDLLRARTEIKQRRVEAENSYRQLQAGKGNLEAMPLVLRNTNIDRLKNIEAEAGRRVDALSKRYGPDDPRMVRAEKELKQARENTARGIQAVVASLGKEYEVAGADERAVDRSLAGAKGSIQDLNRKEFQLDALQADVTTNRQIYERFLNRYRETRAAGDTQSSVVARVVDPAIPPGSPYKPRKDRIILIGFILGLILSAIGALLRELVDNKIKSAAEVEEKLGVPTLAVLPLLKGASGKGVGRHYLEEPGSVFSEAIRTARTSLMLSAIDAPHKTLLVTSSLPNEGKSAFAVNLALAHAQTKKVLLIEADLRRPSLARHLGLDESRPGLTALFSGGVPFAECVQRVEGSSLYVLPCGALPANPSELLSSEHFAKLLVRIASACDIVIIDSPPVYLVSDSAVLSTLVNGVLFVLKADSTPYPVARRSIRTLQDAGANVIGVALNQLDFTKAARYYGAYTHYANEYRGYTAKAS